MVCLMHVSSQWGASSGCPYYLRTLWEHPVQRGLVGVAGWGQVPQAQGQEGPMALAVAPIPLFKRLSDN